MKETIFDSLPVIGKSLAEIKPSDKYREKCPAGSALAMSIAQNAVQLKKQNKLLTVICADPSDVIRLQDEVTWFGPSLKLTVFPDWETLPYDQLSPHQDIISARLKFLADLPYVKNASLIIPLSALMSRLPPRSFLQSRSLHLKTGDHRDIQEMQRELTEQGYL